eukprot:6534107-Pyramimonas_sp.AAC.1
MRACLHLRRRKDPPARASRGRRAHGPLRSDSPSRRQRLAAVARRGAQRAGICIGNPSRRAGHL